MAQETSKCTERRLKDRSRWDHIFGSFVIDVGPGDDPLVWPEAQVTPFDKKEGDANKIDEYFNHPLQNMPTCIHGSQVMEHLHHPADFINRCLTILRPGGWIVMTVPDFDLYEKRHFPSKFNPDHKTTWSLWRPSRIMVASTLKFPHIHVPTWIKQFNVAQRYATLIDTNYDYLKDDSIDQTWLREDGVECWIEILLQKHP